VEENMVTKGQRLRLWPYGWPIYAGNIKLDKNI
jgi:hypothetical protein